MERRAYKRAEGSHLVGRWGVDAAMITYYTPPEVVFYKPPAPEVRHAEPADREPHVLDHEQPIYRDGGIRQRAPRVYQYPQRTYLHTPSAPRLGVGASPVMGVQLRPRVIWQQPRQVYCPPGGG